MMSNRAVLRSSLPTRPACAAGLSRSAEEKSSRRSRLRKPWRKLLLYSGLWTMSAAGALAGGCASVPRIPPAPEGPAERTVLADWDDAEAAARVGLRQVGVADLRVDRPAPGKLVYHVLTASDQPGTLTLERLASPEAADPVEVRIDAAIGRFGEDALEHELVRRVAERLEDLRGVEYAPVRQ